MLGVDHRVKVSPRAVGGSRISVRSSRPTLVSLKVTVIQLEFVPSGRYGGCDGWVD